MIGRLASHKILIFYAASRGSSAGYVEPNMVQVYRVWAHMGQTGICLCVHNYLVIIIRGHVFGVSDRETQTSLLS